MIRVARPASLPPAGDKLVVVEASAGTGKTFFLEHRVVDLILGGAELAQILLVTFTDKAVAELRMRIRDLLDRLARATEDTAVEGEACWELDDDARRLSAYLLPKTGAYHEIWLDGEKTTARESGEEPVDPLYGERYLPRKFKIGLAIPEDNTIDVLTNDLAIVALFEGEALLGYNFLLGGGHGMTHNKPATYPRLATPVAFVEPDDLLEAAAAVVRLSSPSSASFL